MIFGSAVGLKELGDPSWMYIHPFLSAENTKSWFIPHSDFSSNSSVAIPARQVRMMGTLCLVHMAVIYVKFP